jgi:hypothetical protein
MFDGHCVLINFSNDIIAALHARNTGKEFKTFKEWNEKGYGRLVEEMIGYANYVHEQRNEDPESSQPAAPINFDSGPGSLPLLPPENKGIRGSEVAKHAQEIIRAYFLRHYRKCHP